MLNMRRSVVVPAAVVGLAAVALAGCGRAGHPAVRASGPSSAAAAAAGPSAQQTCNGSAMAEAKSIGRVDAVSGAFPSTAGRVAAWQEARVASQGKPGTTSSWRSHPSDEAVVVCYFDGEFMTPLPPPAPGGTAPRAHDRYVIVVGADGTAVPFVAGYRTNTPVEAPG